MSQRFIYPSLMDPCAKVPITNSGLKSNSFEVAVHDDEDGCNNECLEVYNDYVGVANGERINRELVNLENAAVNIDNSNDVIIGAVTQFNVNGNVTIYQGKDGQPIEIKETSGISNGSYKDQSPRSQKEEQEVNCPPQKKRKIPKKYYLAIILLIFLFAFVGIIYFLLKNKTPELHPSKNSTYIDSQLFGSHSIIPKKMWNGRDALHSTPMTTPVDLVVIKHSGSTPCQDFESCAAKMQTLQSISIAQKNLDDIYLNFAVCGDGNIYEGRGWDVQPAESKDNIDLVMIGNFDVDPFTPEMINATKAFLEYGLEHNMLTKTYRLINHNQTKPTLSPGKNVIVEVRNWPHYDPQNYLGTKLSISTVPRTTKAQFI